MAKSSISRRKFLASTSTLTSGLFLGAPYLLSDKGRISTESDPDYFVLIADTHIDENPHRLRNGSNMFFNLEIAVKRILNNDMFGKPAGVLILGDIANTHGLMGEYGLTWSLLRHLQDAGIPVYCAMGNHDNRGNFNQVFPDQESLIRNMYVQIMDAPNAYHIVLDTLARVDEYITGGELGQVQRNWLDQILEKYTDKPVILHGHHYPWHNVQDGNIRGLKDYKELIEITNSHRQVKAYVFGHSHRFDINPYHRVDADVKGLNLLNVPTLAGHSGSQPVGYLHAFFYHDKMELQVECIDTTEQWHGLRETLSYRSDEATSAEDSREKSNTIKLNQNYPNPFNATTRISYSLPNPEHISLKLFNTEGRRVATIIDSFQRAGSHEIIIDASKLNISSGSYIYRLTSNEFSLTRSMTLVK